MSPHHTSSLKNKIEKGKCVFVCLNLVIGGFVGGVFVGGSFVSGVFVSEVFVVWDFLSVPWKIDSIMSGSPFAHHLFFDHMYVCFIKLNGSETSTNDQGIYKKMNSVNIALLPDDFKNSSLCQNDK